MSLPKALVHSTIFLFAIAVILFVDNFDLNITLHMLIYLVVASTFLKSLLQPSFPSMRRGFFYLIYYTILTMELYILMLSNFSNQSRLLVASLLFLTFLSEQIWIHRKESYCVSPSLDENSLSFEDLRYLKKRIIYRGQHIKKVGGVITLSFIRDLLSDLPRNCSIRYVAKENLSETYFKHLDQSLTDPYVYLVFSDTGSPASNFFGILSNKPYNHISISFDRELKTLISYNGGERVMPPGLNPEMLEWFYQKEDASIRIYRLSVTGEQKEQMAKRVAQINQEGSAYNILGAALKKNFQPNMMVCSEFVYSLLDSVGAAYFKKTAIDVKPSDMIELDYERKLEFIETIRLSTCCEELVVKGKPLPVLSESMNQMKIAK
ncbi:MAG: hypothetical protein R3Y63_02150 [Eubacteriales bacterium]